MALAKYYEDIIERLNEDRAAILAKFEAAEFRRLSDKNRDLTQHLERHLEESAKVLSELLEAITNPENDGGMTLAEARLSITHKKALESQLETCKVALAKKVEELEEVCASLGTFKDKCADLERKLRLAKQEQDELGRQLKNSRSKRR